MYSRKLKFPASIVVCLWMNRSRYWRNLPPHTYFALDSKIESRPQFLAVCIGLHSRDKKEMKIEGAKNYRVQLGCHKLITLATYNGRSPTSEKRLLPELEELERINSNILGFCNVRKGKEN